MNKQKASIIGLVVIAVVVGIFSYFYESKKISNTIQTPVNLYYDTTWPATYASVDTWPPEVVFTPGQFSCAETGDVVLSGGKTTQTIIGQKPYCVTASAEGAAGSTYTTYTFVTSGGSDVIATMTFVLKEVQCGNYSDPEKTACETERKTFNIDTFAHRVIENSIE
jgi:hypothetical protein